MPLPGPDDVTIKAITPALTADEERIVMAALSKDWTADQLITGRYVIAVSATTTGDIERLTAERDAIAQVLDDDCAPDIDGQQIKTLADRVNALLGHWQDEIRGALCAVVPNPHRIDGGGCDSGDPLDLTLAEVAQAVNQLTDQADEQIAALTAERADMIAEQQAALSGLIAERDAARAYAAGCEAAADAASNDLEDMREERDAARRDAEERRLELLAERGDAEGAPSQGWRWTGEIWFHPPTCMAVEPAGRLWRLNPDAGDLRRWERFDDMPARAAMLAADKATL